MERRVLISGFGGQGIMFAGKLLVYICMLEGSRVTWMPSYGPEMRGGTAYCGVVVSDAEIGSPSVNKPSLLICLNGPSLDKFEASVVPGGMAFIDNSLAQRDTERGDIKAVYIPAAKIADDNGLAGLGNMVMLGKFINETGICGREFIKQAMDDCVSARRVELIEKNIEAINLGYEFSHS